MQQVVRCFAVCLAFWLISSARAQGPSGELQFSFSKTNTPVWDFSGEYNITNTIEERLTIVHNAGGRIAGTGDAMYDDGGVRVRLTGRFNGRVSGTVASRIQLSASGSGRFSGTSSGRPINGPATFGLAFGLDPQSDTLAEPSRREFACLCAARRSLRKRLSRCRAEWTGIGRWRLMSAPRTTTSAEARSRRW
jgi:hypothetical protein